MTKKQDDLPIIDISDEELEDTSKFWYELWILGSDKDQNVTDYSKLIFKSNEIEKAIQKAEEIYDDPSEIVKELPNHVKFITIEVETVVERNDGNETYTEAIDHVYNRTIEIEK